MLSTITKTNISSTESREVTQLNVHVANVPHADTNTHIHLTVCDILIKLQEPKSSDPTHTGCFALESQKYDK